MSRVRPSWLDQLLRPLHRWVWSDAGRRVRKLLRFAETEADGGRDLARAAELTSDGILRRLYLRHSLDEQRHATLFRRRARALLQDLPRRAGREFEGNWFSPGERGLDDLRVDGTPDDALLAFLHLSEKAAAGRFAIYQEVLSTDPATRSVFEEVLGDEAFHMNYTQSQLARITPRKHGLRLWQARLGRLWKGYLRVATGIAGLLATVVLLLQYLILLPPFVVLARRAARKESRGWTGRTGSTSMQSQY